MGVALTSSSLLEESTKKIQEKFKNCQITKTELNNFFNDTLYSSNLCINSIKKTSNIVNIFKQLSIENETSAKELINLHDLVNNVLLSIKYSSNLKNTSISNNISKNIIINCNPSAFYQIFTQLITNSLNHGFINVPNPTISISGKENNNNIEIEYIDNGIGISKEHHGKIFEPFYTTKRNKGNTGLGLSIIHNCIHKMGGNITFNKEYSKGVHFIIQL